MIDVSQLDFAYGSDGFRLRIDEFHVAAGSHVALIGPSGSGKSTLLHLLSGILVARAGTIIVDGRDLRQLGDSARRDFRISNIGLVFQEFELLDYLNVLDNILLPFRINNALSLTDHVRQRARDLMKYLEIDDKVKRYPAHLSQGEKQRVAIGRALITEPGLLLADEPTGNLDPVNKDRVLELMLHQARQRNVTVVMVTHDYGLLDRFEQVFDVRDFHGRVEASETDELAHAEKLESQQK
jgi:ABC-type lipoprotein export system ATPase subunit